MEWGQILAHCSSVETPWREGAIVRRPPPSRAAVEAAVEAAGDLPEEYSRLLEISDGVVLFPKRPGYEGGIAICSLAELAERTSFAYYEDDPGPGRRSFFVVGYTVGEGAFLGIRGDGSLWYLDHEYSFQEWEQGAGAIRLADTLKQFVLTLADHKGRYWWQGRKSNQ